MFKYFKNISLFSKNKNQFCKNCIFCNIVKDKKAGIFFLENKYAVAIKDINPVEKEHMLIITKKHYKNLSSCSTKYLKGACSLVRECAKKMLIKYPDIKGFNYISNENAIAKQIIFHLHIHIIPRYEKEKLK